MVLHYLVLDVLGSPYLLTCANQQNQDQATHLHNSTPPTPHHPKSSSRKESTRTETPKDSSKDKAIVWCFVCLSTSSALNTQPVAFFPKDLAETHAAANEGISKKIVANLRFVLLLFLCSLDILSGNLDTRIQQQNFSIVWCGSL